LLIFPEISVNIKFRKSLQYYSCSCLYDVFKGAAGWMGDPDIPLKGFPWKGGAERDTSGILMWSEPFEVLLPSGEKVGMVCCSCTVYFSKLTVIFFCQIVA